MTLASPLGLPQGSQNPCPRDCPSESPCPTTSPSPSTSTWWFSSSFNSPARVRSVVVGASVAGPVRDAMMTAARTHIDPQTIEALR